ncbi:MAG: response regulator transcription factor [Actinobacteria bacterium]|jgi:DNA-binding response OmpR family regulator|nr:response regulator transcription factor [Actinomycetota bacterium]
MTGDTGIRRVLVADDDPHLRDLLVLNLLAEGFEVHAFGDGREACRNAAVIQPDLIVLDVMMPEQDGLSALRQIKADPQTAHVPIVLLTARASDAEVWEGWESGADYYITKPFDIDELLHFVRYLQVEHAASAAAAGSLDGYGA